MFRTVTYDIHLYCDSSVELSTFLSNFSKNESPKETRMRLLMIGTIFTNPLCVPLMWYILRSYKQKWKEGSQTIAKNSLKRAVLYFSLGVFMTAACLIIVTLCFAFHGQPENRNFRNDGYTLKKTGSAKQSRYPSKKISTMNFTALVEESRKKAVVDVELENDRTGGSNFQSLDKVREDAKIKFHNETFIVICVKGTGCNELNIREGFG